MAMQKRTDSTRALRRQAELAVDMFLDVLLSDNDAVARESRSVIGALVEFKGQIPKSSGYSEVCTLAAKVDRMQRFSDLHLMACVLLRNLSDRQRDALVFDRFYRNRTKVAVDPFSERRVEIHWDDAACAQALRCTVSTFQKRVYDGYQSLEAALSDTAPFTKAA
ncbi:hypothetical protein [Marinobacter sp. MDS2]|uniref:hypothetical protein n=1 Tax=Marinobacter sp. MDS2 TaxID=3065961 RepID=UPI00273B69DE|nr:hypothetical protein [Marinobacter sp. MDS2]MDP4546501.1 hypothetical protein [Marinobacter sp. MDS2]